MGNVDVVTGEEIARERDVVAAYACDPDNARLWYENIESVEWQTPRPLGEGSRISFRAHFLWRKLDYTYEVTEYQPGEKLVMRTQAGPFPMETTYTFTTVSPGRTRVELRNSGKPSGFSRLVAPFMAPAMRKANRKDLSALKRILEAQPTAAGH